MLGCKRSKRHIEIIAWRSHSWSYILKILAICSLLYPYQSAMLKFWVSWFVFFGFAINIFKTRWFFNVEARGRILWPVDRMANSAGKHGALFYLSLPFLLLKLGKLIELNMFHLSLNFLFSSWFWFWCKYFSTQKEVLRRKLSLLCSDVHRW